MDGTIYLDHNATTAIRPAAASVVAEALAWTGNPSSVHRHGRLARRVVEDAREHVADLVGAEPSQVVMTSGGTEANRLAIGGFQGQAIVSAVEHLSVLGAAKEAKHLPVDNEGRVDVEALDALLATRRDGTPTLVSVMWANNETGVLQPLAEVVEVARRHGAFVHCDAAQAVGRVAVDFAALGVHMMTVSAHKLGGPAGVGALIVGDDAPLAMMAGGGQERGRRAGTENVAGIAGFGAAADVAKAELAAFDALVALRDGLEARIGTVTPAARIFGQGAPRLPNTTCVTMPGVDSETQVMAFDLAGIAVSAGAACSSGKVGPSHVLRAMGIEEDEARTAIRVSLGWTTTAADVARFVDEWAAMFARLGGQPPAATTAA